MNMSKTEFTETEVQQLKTAFERLDQRLGIDNSQELAQFEGLKRQLKSRNGQRKINQLFSRLRSVLKRERSKHFALQFARYGLAFSTGATAAFLGLHIASMQTSENNRIDVVKTASNEIIAASIKDYKLNTVELTEKRKGGEGNLYSPTKLENSLPDALLNSSLVPLQRSLEIAKIPYTTDYIGETIQLNLSLAWDAQNDSSATFYRSNRPGIVYKTLTEHTQNSTWYALIISNNQKELMRHPKHFVMVNCVNYLSIQAEITSNTTAKDKIYLKIKRDTSQALQLNELISQKDVSELCISIKK
jgi:hypothetical protein